MLRLHFNGNNSFLFINTVKMYQFKAKDSQIKPHPLYLGNISKNFTIDSMKKIGLKGAIKYFTVDFNANRDNNILDIHRYLMKET